MSIKAGTTLYRYSIRRNKFCIHEGIVNDCGTRRLVIFNEGTTRSVRCPREEDIGVLRNTGRSLWFTERDDELARQIFIDFEEHKLHQLEKLYNAKISTIYMLRGE